MSWQLLAVIAAISSGLARLIHRRIMKDESHMAYSWIFNVLSGMFFLPILASGIKIPASSYAWALAFFAAFIWASIAMIGFKSYRYTQVSLRDPLSRMDTIFLLLFSGLILGESINGTKLAGVLVIFSGLIILTWHKGKILGKISDKGVKLTLFTAILSGFVAVVDKLALAYFLPAFYGFLMFIIPAVYLTPLALRDRNEIKSLVSNKAVWVVIASILGAVSYYSQLSAYTITEVSNVFPILQLSTLVTVIGGFVFHKEKDLGVRLTGAALMILGSTIIFI